MLRAFRVKRYDHVTPAKRRRLLEESLIPILDESTQDLSEIQNLLQKGDWLIEYNDRNKPFYLYRVISYRHEPRLHLYIKHYIEADSIFKLESTHLSNDHHTLLASANHLEVLPAELLDIANSYNERIVTDYDERFKQLIFKLKLKRNILPAHGRNVLRELESVRPEFHSRLKEALIHVSSDLVKSVREKRPEISDPEWEEFLPTLYNGQWESREKALFELNEISTNDRKPTPPSPAKEYIDPSKVTGAISKAALGSYMKKHNGQLPTVKEFEKITNKFRTTSRSRR